MMGPCRVCKQPGCYGYSQPGLMSNRNKKGYVWACADHRSEVEETWRKAFNVMRGSNEELQRLPGM